VKVLPKILILIGAVGVGLGLGSILSTNAESVKAGNPGSIDDPIVTKGYVDQQVQQLVKAELAKQTMSEDKLQKMLDDFRKEMAANKGGGTSLEVITLKVGQKLIVAEGAEIIVRAGKAVAYSADGSGLSDLTEGSEIANGKPVEKNHLILAPREGRGVTPDPKQKNGVTALVRGNYAIEG